MCRPHLVGYIHWQLNHQRFLHKCKIIGQFIYTTIYVSIKHQNAARKHSGISVREYHGSTHSLLLARSLAHSLTRSLTCSLTRSPPPSLPHSLTHTSFEWSLTDCQIVQVTKSPIAHSVAHLPACLSSTPL